MFNFRRLTPLVLAASLLFTPATALAEESIPDAQDGQVRIGVMPATDSVPILWADQHGYFEEAGVDVVIVPFTNGLNRITAMQTGNLEAGIEGMVEFLNTVEKDPSYGRLVSATNANFQVVTKEDLTTLDHELQVGSLLNSVVHYLSMNYFEQFEQGYTEQFIPEIPVRMQMLGQGALDAAILPEPVASTAALQGLNKTRLDLADEQPNGLIFHTEFTQTHPEKIEAFVAAYDKAVEDLQDSAKVEEAKALLIDTFDMNSQLTEFVDFPTFKPASLQSEDYIKSLQAWLQTNYDAEFNTPYSELVVQ